MRRMHLSLLREGCAGGLYLQGVGKPLLRIDGNLNRRKAAKLGFFKICKLAESNLHQLYWQVRLI